MKEGGREGGVCKLASHVPKPNTSVEYVMAINANEYRTHARVLTNVICGVYFCCCTAVHTPTPHLLSQLTISIHTHSKAVGLRSTLVYPRRGRTDRMFWRLAWSALEQQHSASVCCFVLGITLEITPLLTFRNPLAELLCCVAGRSNTKHTADFDSTALQQ